MKIHVSEICPAYDFEIDGTSYAGEPKSNTAMFVSKKVQHLLNNLRSVKNCLVFLEEGAEIPVGLQKEHALVLTENPQYMFAKFAERLFLAREEEEKRIPYRLTENGSYISESAVIGENAYIGIGCIIGHNVRIGNNARIMDGSIIKHAVIGNNFICNERAVVGSFAFTMSDDENGKKYRIPTLGLVWIGNDVEVGAHDNISCGSCGDTVIEDHVKLDALIHIGHDAHLHNNVEITAGVTIAGFVDVGENAYFGVASCTRNRINIGANSIIGMGSTVIKSVDKDTTVVGNPAKPLLKR